MSFEEVYRLFLVYTDLSENEASLYSALCTNAIAQVREELKSESSEQENGRRLNSAAAALAYYNYALIQSGRNTAESFKAGDITITESGVDLKSARELWENEKKEIAHLICDNSFEFKRA